MTTIFKCFYYVVLHIVAGIVTVLATAVGAGVLYGVLLLGAVFTDSDVGGPLALPFAVFATSLATLLIWPIFALARFVYDIGWGSTPAKSRMISRTLFAYLLSVGGALLVFNAFAPLSACSGWGITIVVILFTAQWSVYWTVAQLIKLPLAVMMRR